MDEGISGVNADGIYRPLSTVLSRVCKTDDDVVLRQLNKLLRLIASKLNEDPCRVHLYRRQIKDDQRAGPDRHPSATNGAEVSLGDVSNIN